MNHAALFRKPARIVAPADWIGHIPFAFWIVEATRPALVVELGTVEGNAYFAFCQAVEVEGLHTQCRAFDTWLDQEVLDNLALYNQQHYNAFSQLLRLTCHEALKHVDNHSVDLLHVAGRQAPETLKQIIDSWIPKMSDRGIILIDTPNGLNQEFIASYPCLAFNHSGSLGVLAVGTRQNAAFSEMIAEWKRPEGRQKIQAMFACAGRALESAYRTEQLDKTLQEREHRVSLLETKIRFIEEEAFFLRNELFKLTTSPWWQIRRFIQKTAASIKKRAPTLKNLSSNPSGQSLPHDTEPAEIALATSGNRPSIGLYNDSWSFYGGGENHALSLVPELQQKGTVYLIAETDFDIPDIERYFSLDLSQCKKIVDSRFNTESTRYFDVFINACHRSKLDSRAKTSLYIITFPHRNITRNLIQSYYFLFISEYTKKWSIQQLGSDIKGDIIYPVRMLLYKTDVKPGNKEKVILSVGRFFSGGHCKNQLETVRAFSKVVREHPEAREWKLVLAGGYETSDLHNIMYYHQILTESKHLNVEVLTNISRIELDDLYRKSALYIHAAGLGQSETLHPENHEHFGITVLEATMFGCLPLVYKVGGPAEIVQKIGYGYIYDSMSTMQSLMIQLFDRFSHHHEVYLTESKNISERSKAFVIRESAKPIPCTDKLIERHQ